LRIREADKTIAKVRLIFWRTVQRGAQ
jgi:hypothetical protein